MIKNVTENLLLSKGVPQMISLIPITKIARDLKIPPRLARAKARSSDEIARLCQSKERWEFRMTDAKRVKQLLRK